MRTPWTERIISLHPGVVTGSFLVLFIGGGVANNIFPLGSPASTTIWAVSMVLMMSPIILWHYCLREVAERKAAARRGTRPRRPFFFAIFFVSYTAFLVPIRYSLTMLTPNAAPLLEVAVPALLMITVISYFGAIWTAADALLRFTEGHDHVPFHKTIGAFFLEFYLPIGIWFLRPRIRRLLAHEISTAARR